jgi:D-glycero-alpha-D-manno-heptose-7-phosphate kinase
MSLTVQAPTRITLGGATLDIYPLYLFEEGGLTLNAAIDLCSEVELEEQSEDRIRIESTDLGLVLEGPDLEELQSNGEFAPLDLVLRVLKFYRPGNGLIVRTKNNVPPGSGLGGSSSLLIALSTALLQWENRPVNKKRMIDFGANIEAQSIRIPTGKQDYFPPAYGGFHALWFEIQGIRRERLTFSARFENQLQDRILLGYSGVSRFSGSSNWNIMRKYISKEGATVVGLSKIKEIAFAAYHSLKEEDLDQFAECLARDWENQKGLAEGVSTPEIDRIFEAAREAGAQASKICGAGGGGCFLTVVGEGCQQEVKKAIEGAGGEVLDYHFSKSGVQVVQ